MTMTAYDRYGEHLDEIEAANRVLRHLTSAGFQVLTPHPERNYQKPDSNRVQKEVLRAFGIDPDQFDMEVAFREREREEEERKRAVERQYALRKHAARKAKVGNTPAK